MEVHWAFLCYRKILFRANEKYFCFKKHVIFKSVQWLLRACCIAVEGQAMQVFLCLAVAEWSGLQGASIFFYLKNNMKTLKLHSNSCIIFR